MPQLQSSRMTVPSPVGAFLVERAGSFSFSKCRSWIDPPRLSGAKSWLAAQALAGNPVSLLLAVDDPGVMSASSIIRTCASCTRAHSRRDVRLQDSCKCSVSVECPNSSANSGSTHPPPAISSSICAAGPQSPSWARW